MLRFFTRLKCQLMPYLFGAACQAHEHGIPILRPMLLEFPDDPACDTLDRQYMLGSDLLVAPVFSEHGFISYYVPAGLWTNFLSGEQVQGPGWAKEQHDFMSLPLLVRPNTIIPVGAQDGRPDYDFAEGVQLQVFALEDGAQTVVNIPDLSGKTGATFTARREGKTVTIQREMETGKQWQVLLVNIHQVEEVSRGEAEGTTKGIQIKLDGSHSNINIRIH